MMTAPTDFSDIANLKIFDLYILFFTLQTGFWVTLPDFLATLVSALQGSENIKGQYER